MRERKAISKRQGQLTGTEKGAAAKLSSWLPGYGLEKLSDAEAARLLGLIDYLDRLAASEGFRYGWTAAQSYNSDVARLNGAGPSTEH